MTLLKALGISFIGSLPVGIMNMSALQVTLAQGEAQGLAFSACAILIEGVIMFTTGVLAQKLTKENKRMRQMGQVTMLLLFCLGIFFLSRAMSPAAVLQKTGASTDMPGWLYGISLRLLNPTAIIYWFGVHMAMSQGKQLEQWYFQKFAVGGMIGTFCAYSVYIFSARWLGGFLAPMSAKINILLAILCFLGIIWQWRNRESK